MAAESGGGSEQPRAVTESTEVPSAAIVVDMVREKYRPGLLACAASVQNARKNVCLSRENGSLSTSAA